MIFTETAYLPFLASVLAAFFLLRDSPRGRLALLCLSSFFFYGWGGPHLLPLLLATTLVDFVVGGLIHGARSPGYKRFLLGVSLVCNLGVLGFFKYTNFVAGSLGLGGPYEIPLPFGISFYTFQSMSYTLDVYFGRLAPCRSPVRFFAFVSFFPQLVAGPILRAKEFLPQIERVETLAVRSDGLVRILYGLAKKLWLADALGTHVVDPAFADPAAHAGPAMWLAVYAYAFQIFLDFSAYSDIAIGSAGLFGLSIPENFRSPYLAASFKEFWSRWHISLSTWLRDYLYIPLGGNRGGAWFVRRNLMLTMVLGGFWHGAAWTVVLWGILHGAFLVLHRDAPFERGLPRWAARLAVFHLTCLGWVFFRSATLDQAGAVLGALASGGPFRTPFVLAAGGLVLAAWALHDLVEPRVPEIDRIVRRWPFPVRSGLLAAWVLGMIWHRAVHAAQTPFIYFQF